MSGDHGTNLGIASQDTEGNFQTNSDMDMDMEMITRDDALISHDDIMRVSAAMLAERKAQSVTSHIHNPDPAISSSAKEVLNGKDSFIERQEALISRLIE
ncbi:hypothetical protein PtrCC142_005282 [Pyrenophora tritici-repentis]|nr:hypothetical protein PtrSN001C_005186 [Pyrenophora tritici-repentis]KAI1570613.1 hypothetical protein PtrEW4_005256 [Pyrenophora tritici-repentis]KAI1602559.1 hypothetical protein PtrCC142_005282 [Pyrenophora tritici-repentis]